jgi:DNA-binding NarL/FixJ family response regulator
MIRVLLVEDHPVVRAGLSELLSGTPDIEVVGMAPNGREALPLVEEMQPDVVLMDVSMPEMDGIEATRRIARSGSSSKVVMLSSFSDRKGILAAIDAGASGFLLKDAEPAELFRGVRAAAAGEAPLAPKAARVVLSDRRSEDSTEGLAAPAGVALTAREREVLRLVAEGMASKLIARRLEISEKTVKAHLTRIYRELGVDTRTEAALWAASNLEADE